MTIARIVLAAVALLVLNAGSADFGAEVADGGLEPKAETFAAFAISPTAITVWFTPEQLGNVTSAGGRTAIPLSELRGLLRPL